MEGDLLSRDISENCFLRYFMEKTHNIHKAFYSLSGCGGGGWVGMSPFSLR